MTELLYYDLKQAKPLTPGLSAQVCRELGRRIVSGTQAEGSLIDDETKLAEKFSVSKSVIREAIKLLVGKGLIEVRRGSGTRVLNRRHWMLLDDDVLAWHQSVTPSPGFLRQLMDMRRLMEPKAASWAAEFGSDEAHDAIRQAHQRMELKAASVEDFVVADALFHRAILRAAGNEFLLNLEGVIFSALLTSIKLTNADPRENESSIPVHRAVMEAVLRRDPVAAEREMLAHLDDTTRRLSAAVQGFDLR
ncbi:FadR/GntR family transcriptional regulator [Pseudoruegeria sp. SK021]|uniref:FadR/GntR family transcriptional regulator n=1 Tax=Pseudoruegeria sp. SK021 TaxID=1933035 RepID=UPI000A2582CB|nr:FadR/GntR family transcriptional regulator [Pseudoruegeria sp. SK021]OSP55780.1 GntR family transcriptional regulator [Pseudoruegeria sp. SK021]